MQSIDTGHSSNIFCTKFVPETSDELVVSGAGDSEVMFSLLCTLACEHSSSGCSFSHLVEVLFVQCRSASSIYHV